MTTELATQPTTEDCNWAMAAHLSALVAFLGIPFGHVAGPLVVYLVKREQSPFVAEHAKASLNFQLTVTIATIVFFGLALIVWLAFVLLLPSGGGGHASNADYTASIWIFGGWIVMAGVALGVGVAAVVLIIMATVAAGSRRPYRYPFAIRFVR